MSILKETYGGKLSFEYNIHHKNWGLVDNDEPFELHYEGTVTKLFEPNSPKTIAMFELMVYELDKANKFNQVEPLLEMMNDLSYDIKSRFTNFSKLMNDYDLDFKGRDKIIYLKNIIIHPDYRGGNILDELIKSIYITHYSKNSLFLLNAYPTQEITEEFEYYYNDHYINISDGNKGELSVLVGDYFNLNDLPKEYDEEIDYKLFARMQKLNFTKFEDTSYFYLKDEEDILELFKKNEKTSNIKNSN